MLPEGQGTLTALVRRCDTAGVPPPMPNNSAERVWAHRSRSSPPGRHRLRSIPMTHARPLPTRQRTTPPLIPPALFAERLVARHLQQTAARS